MDRSNLDVTSKKGQIIQSGITVMDPYTGNVVAIVGAMDPKEGNLVSNYATMKKQVGSSIKPSPATPGPGGRRHHPRLRL